MAANNIYAAHSYLQYILFWNNMKSWWSCCHCKSPSRFATLTLLPTISFPLCLPGLVSSLIKRFLLVGVFCVTEHCWHFFYPLNYIYLFEATGYMAALVDLLSYFVMHKLLTLVNKLQSVSSKHSYCLKTHLAQMHYWHCKGRIFIRVYSVGIKFPTIIHALTIKLKLTQVEVKVKFICCWFLLLRWLWVILNRAVQTHILWY